MHDIITSNLLHQSLSSQRTKQKAMAIIPRRYYRSICFVNVADTIHHWTRDYLPRKIAPVGGVQTGHYWLSEYLRKRGWKVRWVLRRIPGKPELDGYRGIRLHYTGASPRTIWQAMRAADASLYYYSGWHPILFEVARFCRFCRRKLVLRMSADFHLERWRCSSTPLFERMRMWWGAQMADAICAQTEYQRRWLARYVARAAEVMPEFQPQTREAGRPLKRGGKYVLWVANFTTCKRPDWVGRVARLLPHIYFIMIGGKMPGSERLYKAVRGEMVRTDNVKFLGFLSYQEAERYFAGAAIFLSTSLTEGFPNTFLQAWKFGVPVVSAVDPDGLLKRYGIGYHGRTINALAAKLQGLWKDEDLCHQMGQRAKKIFNEQFSLKVVAPRYERLFLSLLAPTGNKLAPVG